MAYTSTEDLLISLRNWLDEWYEQNGLRSDRRVELAEELQTLLIQPE